MQITQKTMADAKGKVKMKSESPDTACTALLVNLRVAMKNLAKRIEPKVYEYGGPEELNVVAHESKVFDMLGKVKKRFS